MKRRTLGTILVVVGAIGLVVMTVASGLFLWQSSQVRTRADSVIVPVSGGLDDLQGELDTVDALVDELVAVLPVESVVELAGRIDELTARIETIGGYLVVADRALGAIEAIPFLPIDTEELRSQLDGLNQNLASLSAQFGEVASFILQNQDVPGDIAAGVTGAIDQLRAGLDAGQLQVENIAGAIDRWLVVGSILVVVLLLWSIVGQVALILWGRELRSTDAVTAV
jgi:hypothetical protein